MNDTLIQSAPETAETNDIALVTELQVAELALVGGGMANFSFV
jgi:hypothetical protein